MSFPSAAKKLQEWGATPATATPEQADAALRYAMERDTPMGYTAYAAIAEAVRENANDPLAFIRARLMQFGFAVQAAVLRVTPLGHGLRVDIDPKSSLAAEGARLMTDAVRPLLARAFELSIGFANCHAVLISKDGKEVVVTSSMQIEWQENPHC